MRVFDELRGDCDLGADVAELGGYAEEELVLPAKGFVFVAGEIGALFGLEGQVGVGDFGDGREKEDNGEEEDESSDAQVRPLDFGEVVRVGILKEDAGC